MDNQEYKHHLYYYRATCIEVIDEHGNVIDEY